MITYSAIAGSWPNTLQTVTPFGTASRSIWSSPACHRLQQAQPRGGRKVVAPDMADDDLGIREQWRQMRRVALIGEDLCLEWGLYLGRDARRDRGGEPTEGHLGLPTAAIEGRGKTA